MKVPGIEEMLETYENTMRAHPGPLSVDRRRAGLLAVFETHVKGMLVNAFLAGTNYEANFAKPGRENREGPDQYADRILAQLKEPRHD